VTTVTVNQNKKEAAFFIICLFSFKFSICLEMRKEQFHSVSKTFHNIYSSAWLQNLFKDEIMKILLNPIYLLI